MREWPEPKNHKEKVLLGMVKYGNQMMKDAILMAMFIRGMERPTFMDKDIEHTERTFNLKLWEG